MRDLAVAWLEMDHNGRAEFKVHRFESWVGGIFCKTFRGDDWEVVGRLGVA